VVDQVRVLARAAGQPDDEPGEDREHDRGDAEKDADAGVEALTNREVVAAETDGAAHG
jgi:hypothetical protein